MDAIDKGRARAYARRAAILGLTGLALIGTGTARGASCAGSRAGGCSGAPRRIAGIGGPVAQTAGFDVVNVGSQANPRPVPPGFVGVSLEYKTVGAYEGTDAEHSNPVLAQLIRNLAPGQNPILRIGGDSTDWTWWPIAGVPRPQGASNSLTPNWLRQARTLAQATRARLILGINLEADNTKIASTEANQLLNGIGRRYVDALEVGNEPMLYPLLPWYHTTAGTKVFGRPSSYDLADYGAEFARFSKVLPDVPLAGPAIGHSWLSQLAPFIRTAPRLRMVTFHSYAINSSGDAFRGRNCSTAMTDPAHPSVATLLAPFASQGLMREAAPDIQLAHQRGLSFRVDEMNAVTCAGTPGVSDTFASALWVLNALFSMVNAGVDGVNVHSWRGSAGKLFAFSDTNGQWSASVRPEYYGLLMFAQATPAGARLLPTEQTNGNTVESWATIAPDHARRVLLINHSLAQTTNVVLHLPRAAPRAQLERLRAPSPGAQSGVTLGGQSFGAVTTTAALAGPVRDVSLVRRSGGYSVQLPAASATLITIP